MIRPSVLLRPSNGSLQWVTETTESKTVGKRVLLCSVEPLLLAGEGKEEQGREGVRSRSLAELG